jgi:chemosensory pili system protein ChpA (sensor histidine kinase/response regulator)
MRLDDFLSVLRGEFAQAADDIDTALAAWMGDPASAETHCEGIAATFDKLASVARMVGLEGQALTLEQLRDGAQLVAISDEAAMAEGLGWLALWREPLAAAFDTPGDAIAAQAVVDHLNAGPAPLPDDAAADLARLLRQAPELPRDDAESRAAAFAAPEDGDVSLAVPEDVDAGLYETFLADAPGQLASLGDTVRALARGPVDLAAVTEAQRTAHTFKGSGNIIGIRGVGKLAHRMEDLLDFAIVQGGALPQPMARDLEAAAATLDQMVYSLRGEEEAPADALQRLTTLVDWARAIDDGTWEERLGEVGMQATPAPVAAARPAAADAPTANTAPDTESQVRVAASRVDRLVRQAGQHLVQQGRIAEQIARVEERLAAITASHSALTARLSQLQAQIDRQGVSLQEKADQAGDFDALEMDRYNELHALTRFVAEMAADADDLARGTRDELREASQGLADHGRALKAQHGELLGARLVPFRNIAARLRRNVSQTAATTGKQVRLEIEGEQIQLDGDVLERLTEPLLHLLRNAVDHGIEPAEERTLFGKPAEGLIKLSVTRDGQTVRVVCRDDGRGLDLAAIHAKALALGLVGADVEPTVEMVSRLILLPGFSTRDEVTDVSGRGVGMDVVAERLRAMKGHLDIESAPLEGSSFTLRVPATTGAAHVLVVDAAGERFALPTEAVVMGLAAGQGVLRDGRLVLGERDWPVQALAALLGLPEIEQPAAERPAVVLRSGREEIAVWIDRVVEARELILQDTGRLLQRLRGVGSGALRSDGRVLFLLDPEALGSRDLELSANAAGALRQRLRVERRRALVVDDSLSVRKTLSQLLVDAGYEVRTARDGFDALEALSRERADIVLTDLEMPNLNGLDLTRRIRQSPTLAALPVVMITSRATDKHRAGAQDVGVSAYLTKPYTDGELLGQVRELLVA